MKVAVLSESPADEAAIRVLVEGILAAPIEATDFPLQTRGWPSVLQVLPSVIKHLHYMTDADALAVVVDSDMSQVHTDAHAFLERSQVATCRLCRLRAVLDEQLPRLRPVAGRMGIKTAVGLAVPAIEAWFRCGRDPRVSEASWKQHQPRTPPYTVAQLKRAVYGTDRPGLSVEIDHARNEAKRLTTMLGNLRNHFPGGFGAFFHDVRSWSAGRTSSIAEDLG